MSAAPVGAFDSPTKGKGEEVRMLVADEEGSRVETFVGASRLGMAEGDGLMEGEAESAAEGR